MEIIKFSASLLSRAFDISRWNDRCAVESILVWDKMCLEATIPRSEFGYKRIYRKGRFIKLERI